MTVEISKEWCLRMAELEGDASIAAGVIAIDPLFEDNASHEDHEVESNIAFGRFVRLMRRSRRLSREDLANNADIEILELVEIEDDIRHKPELRTVHKLSQVFGLPSVKLMQVAGLAKAKNDNLARKAERFAARSDPMAELTPEERAALEEFIAGLSEDN
jgi:transcriptional regulator with XRE-family HTH domain